MPSQSKSQQRLMGQAYAYKKGELKSSEVSAEIKELADNMTLKQLKDFASTKHEGLPETVDEAFIGPFVFNDSMSDEELLGMYNGALDGYANYAKGMHYAKSDYKKAYQEIEKILKKRGITVDENITPANLTGMGPVVLPNNGTVGSGDVPAGSGDAEEEYKKKKKKRKEMKHLTTFEAFTFDYQGTDIRNPFTDETARMDVDPNSYYGKDYAKSDIKKIVDASEAFIAKYNEWKDYAPLDADEDLHADFSDYVKSSLDELVKIVKKHG